MKLAEYEVSLTILHSSNASVNWSLINNHCASDLVVDVHVLSCFDTHHLVVLTSQAAADADQVRADHWESERDHLWLVDVEIVRAVLFHCFLLVDVRAVCHALPALGVRVGLLGSLNESGVLVDDSTLFQVELLTPCSTMALNDNCVHFDVVGLRRPKAALSVVLAQMHSQKEVLVLLHLDAASVVSLQ